MSLVVFGQGRFAGFAVLLLIDGEVTRVLLTVADNVSMFLRSSKAQLLGACSAGRLHERKITTSPRSYTPQQVADMKHSPFRTRRDLVEVFSALLAEVLVGAGFLLHDADAATVLPDLADVALDKQTT